MALFSKGLLWYGVLFGILDWVSDIIYVITKTASNNEDPPAINPALLNACTAFIVLQPLFFFFIHTVYMASHS